MKKKATISNNVSEQLEAAAQEALDKIDPFQQLMNAGVEYEQTKKEQEDKPKRKRRTKAEIEEEKQKLPEEDESLWLRCSTPHHLIATVVWDQDKDDENKLPIKIEIPDSILVNDWDAETIGDYLSNTVGYCHKEFEVSWPERHENHEEFCQWEIEKAHYLSKENPDFDYRRFYQDGDFVYLVRHYPKLQIKELIYMRLRTIYARSMVGTVEKQYCQCVEYCDRDNVFYGKQEALDYFNSIKAKVADEYNEDTGKKKRKRKKKDIEEDVEVDIEDIEVDDDSEDGDDE